MKKLIFILTFLPGVLFGQLITEVTFLKTSPDASVLPGINRTQTAIGWGAMFISGVAAGYKEVILHHYPQFKTKHPGANDLYFNPEISWKNKYRDWDNGDTRAKFPGAKTIFVGATDFYHLTGIVDHSFLIAGTTTIVIGEKRKWYEYAIQIVGGIAVRAAGFSLVYDVIYK